MERGDMATKLARFLLSQHILPHCTTGKSPAELLMGRRLHTALDRLHPDLQTEMVDKQGKQALRGRQGVREFEPQDTVFIRNYLTGPKWLPGVVTEITVEHVSGGGACDRAATTAASLVMRATTFG